MTTNRNWSYRGLPAVAKAVDRWDIEPEDIEPEQIRVEVEVDSCFGGDWYEDDDCSDNGPFNGYNDDDVVEDIVLPRNVGRFAPHVFIIRDVYMMGRTDLPIVLHDDLSPSVQPYDIEWLMLLTSAIHAVYRNGYVIFFSCKEDDAVLVEYREHSLTPLIEKILTKVKDALSK